METVVMVQTNKTQLGKLQDHPVLQRLLQSKVLHGGEEVGPSDNVVLQLEKREVRTSEQPTIPNVPKRVLGIQRS